MSPALLLPVGLFALVALAIPIVIHIARRTESRTIDFAALRWLDARPKPRRSLRIDERPLLAVRLLLLSALALWLARPVLWNVADDRRVVAVAPGVDAATIADVAEAGSRVIWLAPGFPETGGPTPRATANVVSLIRQLDAELPPETPVTVLVPATLNGADAERPRLSRQVEWRVGPEIAQPPRTTVAARPPLAIRHSPEGENGARYFRAAATAWAAQGDRPAFDAGPLDRPIPRDARALVWLSDGSMPETVVSWIRDGGTALTSLEVRAPVESETTAVWRGAAGEPLAVAGRLGRGRLIRLTRPLDPAEIPQLVEADFPDALDRMLNPAPQPSRVAAAAHAPLTGAAPYGQAPFDLQPWLALLIGLIFLGERWMATRTQRGPAP